MDGNSIDGLRDKVMPLDEKEQLYRNRLSLSGPRHCQPIDEPARSCPLYKRSLYKLGR